MLQIGDFAGITGLSVKALRHYGEKALLMPATVDENSGYRLYSEGQVRAGVLVRALRAAGVALPTIGSVNGTASAIEVLDAHRQQVLAERAKEDQTYAEVLSELRALLVPVRVADREMPSQHFVGRVLSSTIAEADALTDDDANEAFSKLYERLVVAGVEPSGTFWTTLRSGERGQVELVGCWEVPIDLDGVWAGEGDIQGTLPARRELFATWRPAGGEELPDDATHPAIVAIFDALDERNINLRRDRMEIRQTVLGQEGSNLSVEVSVCLESLG